MLAFLFIIVIMYAIWNYHLQIEWYNDAHGRITESVPREQAKVYMISFGIISMLLYFFLIIRGALKQNS